MEGIRKLPGKPNPVAHIMYSDGLVAISIFIEPFTVTQTQIGLSGGIATMSVFVEPASGPPQTSEATSADGALSVFLRPMGEHVVTVLGEVPPATVRQIAQSVARR